jgi:hypothetical protein
VLGQPGIIGDGLEKRVVMDNRSGLAGPAGFIKKADRDVVLVIDEGAGYPGQSDQVIRVV